MIMSLNGRVNPRVLPVWGGHRVIRVQAPPGTRGQEGC